MFGDFQASVFQDYEEKKDAPDRLSSRLRFPTPAKLKEECIWICENRFDRKDQKVLGEFFGGDCSNAENSIKSIARLDVDRLRPVVTFLKTGTNRPKEIIVEIAAWLIDFEQRPYDSGKTYTVNRKRPDEEKKLGGETGAETQIAPQQKGDTKTGKKVFLVLAILLPVLFTAYWFANEQKCMYWDGDHYRLVPCNEKIEGKEIVAADAAKIKNLKKISTPDTITSKSIGNVWYVKPKRGDFIEFYTSDGFHPIEKDLRLKPITGYIIDKYIDSIRNLKKQVSKQ